MAENRWQEWLIRHHVQLCFQTKQRGAGKQYRLEMTAHTPGKANKTGDEPEKREVAASGKNAIERGISSFDEKWNPPLYTGAGSVNRSLIDNRTRIKLCEAEITIRANSRKQEFTGLYKGQAVIGPTLELVAARLLNVKAEDTNPPKDGNTVAREVLQELSLTPAEQWLISSEQSLLFFMGDQKGNAPAQTSVRLNVKGSQRFAQTTETHRAVELCIGFMARRIAEDEANSCLTVEEANYLGQCRAVVKAEKESRYFTMSATGGVTLKARTLSELVGKLKRYRNGEQDAAIMGADEIERDLTPVFKPDLKTQRKAADDIDEEQLKDRYSDDDDDWAARRRRRKAAARVRVTQEAVIGSKFPKADAFVWAVDVGTGPDETVVTAWEMGDNGWEELSSVSRRTRNRVSDR